MSFYETDAEEQAELERRARAAGKVLVDREGLRAVMEAKFPGGTECCRWPSCQWGLWGRKKHSGSCPLREDA